MHSMGESCLRSEKGWLFVRHSEIYAGRGAIVFIHGLGDSGLAFAEAFDRPELDTFNLIAFDLLGFGRSSAAMDGDYSFRSQAKRIWRALDQFKVHAFTLVGHSMGGDLATLMTSWDDKARVRSLVNIEGNLTPDDLFISSQADEAAGRGEFLEWFHQDFAETTILAGWGQSWPSCRRYFSSLMFCRPAAFRDSARELVQRNGVAPISRASGIGALFCSLNVPKVFCWGEKSLPEAGATRQLLDSEAIPHKSFANAFHWVMMDQPKELYSFLGAFCKEHERG